MIGLSWRCLLLLSVLIPGALLAARPVPGEPPPAPPVSSRGLMPPPENVITQEIDGVLYASGDIYVARHADTTALKRFGFRAFEFLGRSVGTIRYHAVWPLEIDANALPAGLSGLNYAADPPRNDAFREYARNGYAGGDDSNTYYPSGPRQRSNRRGGSYSYGNSYGVGGT
jgi:hypothetical protein